MVSDKMSGAYLFIPGSLMPYLGVYFQVGPITPASNTFDTQSSSTTHCPPVTQIIPFSRWLPKVITSQWEALAVKMAGGDQHSKWSSYQVSQRQARSFPRKRAVAACRACQFRKIKCDNDRPTCSLCQVSGADCIYEQFPDISKYVLGFSPH
jgi:hypothetical protein